LCIVEQILVLEAMFPNNLSLTCFETEAILEDPQLLPYPFFMNSC